MTEEERNELEKDLDNTFHAKWDELCQSFTELGETLKDAFTVHWLLILAITCLLVRIAINHFA